MLLYKILQISQKNKCDGVVFFSKVSAMPTALPKKDNFVKFFRATVLNNTCERLHRSRTSSQK